MICAEISSNAQKKMSVRLTCLYLSTSATFENYVGIESS